MIGKREMQKIIITEKEAIKLLNESYIVDYEGNTDRHRINLEKFLISTLEEIQQYREIGTVEECREAVGKQNAKKPVCVPKPYNEAVGFNDEWHCPSCGSYIGYFTEGMNEPEQMEYCNECGQHIARDWSEEE